MKRFNLPTAALTLALTLAACGQGGDHTAPTVGTVITSAQSGQTATLTVAATDNTGVKKIAYTVKNSSGTTVAAASIDVTGPGPYALTLPALEPGTYTVTIIATDAFNNASAPKQHTVTVTDKTAPVMPSLSGSTTQIGQVVTAHVHATDNTSITKIAYTIRDTTGAVVESGQQGVSGAAPYALVLPALNPGTYTVTVTAYDDGNNASPEFSFPVTVGDQTAPSAPSATGSVTQNQQVLTLGVTAADNAGISKFAYTIANASGTVTSGEQGVTGAAPYALVLPALNAGTYTVTVTAYDASNNASASTTFTVTVNDQTAPTVTNLTPSAGTVSGTTNNPATVTLTATATDAGGGSVARVDFYDASNNQLVGSDANPAGGWTTTVTYDTAQSAADRSYYAVAVDDATTPNPSAQSAQATVNVTVLTSTPPTITANPERVANSAGWYNADVTVSFSCVDATFGIASCTAPITVSVEGAAQPLTGTATNNDGSSSTASFSVSLDKTLPTLTLAGTATASSASYTATGSAADALSGVAYATYSLRQGSSTVISATTVTPEANGTLNMPLTGLSNGTYTLHVTLTDNAGNTTTTDTQTITVDIDAVLPSLTALKAVKEQGKYTVTADISDNRAVTRVVLLHTASSGTQFTYDATAHLNSSTGKFVFPNEAFTQSTVNVNDGIIVRAFDAAGNMREANTVIVNK